MPQIFKMANLSNTKQSKIFLGNQNTIALKKADKLKP